MKCMAKEPKSEVTWRYHKPARRRSPGTCHSRAPPTTHITDKTKITTTTLLNTQTQETNNIQPKLYHRHQHKSNMKHIHTTTVNAYINNRNHNKLQTPYHSTYIIEYNTLQSNPITGCTGECTFGVMYCECYGVCDFVVLSVVEVCVNVRSVVLYCFMLFVAYICVLFVVM